MKNQPVGIFLTLGTVLTLAGCGGPGTQAQPVASPTNRAVEIDLPPVSADRLLSSDMPVVQTGNAQTAGPASAAASLSAVRRPAANRILIRYVEPSMMLSANAPGEDAVEEDSDVQDSVAASEGLSSMIAVSYVSRERMLSTGAPSGYRRLLVQEPDGAAGITDSGPGFIEMDGGLMDEDGLVASSSIPAPETRESVQKAIYHVRLAEKLFSERKLDAAAGEYANALLIYPDNAYVNRQMGRIRLMQGNYHSAASYLSAALDTVEFLAETLNDLGIAHLYSGNPERAIESFDAALKADNGIYEPLYNAALALRALDRLEEARARINEYLLYEPDSARGYRELGVLSYMKGDREDATELLVRAIRHDRHWSVPYLDLAEIYMEEANYVRSLEMLEAAAGTRINPVVLLRFYNRPIFDEARLQPESARFESIIARRLKGQL